MTIDNLHMLKIFWGILPLLIYFLEMLMVVIFEIFRYGAGK